MDNQQIVCQDPSSFPCDCFGLTNCLEVWFFDIISRWIFYMKAPIAHQVSRNVDKMWRAKVSDYFDEVLDEGHRYKNVVASHLGLTIDFNAPRVLIVKQTVTAWKQLFLREFPIVRRFIYPLKSLNQFTPQPSLAFVQPLLYLLCVSCVNFLDRFKVLQMALVALRYVIASAQQLKKERFSASSKD